MDIFNCPLQHSVGDFARLLYGAVHNLFNVTSRIHRCPQNRMSDARPQINYVPDYSNDTGFTQDKINHFSLTLLSLLLLIYLTLGVNQILQ